MIKLFHKSSKKPGTSPGTLVHVGKKKIKKAKISFFDYNDNKLQEKTAKKVEDVFDLKNNSNVSWINIDGLHDTEVINKIGQHFGIHPLVLEDILNTNQRPKLEDLGDYLFIVLKMIDYNEAQGGVFTEQVSLIIGKNFLISFQERIGDVFDPVRDRIRNGKGNIRSMNSDYLAYALLDVLVDNYFLILEKFGEKIEDIEEELLDNPTTEKLHFINSLKRESILLRKSVWPLREIINSLVRGDFNLINKKTEIYFRDVYDHTIQVIDTIETFRDVLAGLQDIYLSSISNRMNEVMKTLTIIATFFIPITFLTGVYGMNFKFMPEIDWHFSYPIFWLIVILVSLWMYIYFRRKKWL